MLSRPEVYSKLASDFVGLRFDWEQGKHYKDRFGFILGTGDQLFLTPSGEVIPHGQKNREGKTTGVYGRHGCDTTGEVLGRIAAAHPKKSNALKLEWFLWPDKQSRRPGGRYPASHTSIAGYARMPIAFVHGEIPAALRDSDFLRWHVRQFIWVRGETNGPSRIIVKRVRDGLKKDLSTEITHLNVAAL